jgi:hypothetical protein
MPSWVDFLQQLLKGLRDTSSELLRRSARLFVEEGGSALVLGIQEGGPADDDHPTVETLVQIVKFILEKRCVDDEGAALKVFGQRKSSDEQQCGFATAACLPAQHPWVQRVREPAREGGGVKTCKASILYQRGAVRLRQASRAVLKQVIVFERLCALYRSALPTDAGGRPHSPRGSIQSGDDGLGQDEVEEVAEGLVSKYQDRLVLTGWHQAPLSAALQIM